MSALIIQEITRDHIAPAASLISAAFAPVSSRNGLPADQDLSPLIARLEEEFRNEIRHFGAWEDGTLVGYFSLIPKDDEVFEVNRLCVHPDFQRKGYGQQLLDHAIAQIRWNGGVAAVCAVIADNTFVLSWLTKNRFFVEVSGHFPGIPCPVSILQKDLPPVSGCTPDGCSGCSGGCG